MKNENHIWENNTAWRIYLSYLWHKRGMSHVESCAEVLKDKLNKRFDIDLSYAQVRGQLRLFWALVNDPGHHIVDDKGKYKFNKNALQNFLDGHNMWYKEKYEKAIKKDKV